MKTFPLIMREIPAYLGRLNLHSVAVEALVQAINHFISLCEADTPTRPLLRILIEYHQLELGFEKQLFALSFDTFGHLSAKTWIISLWEYMSHFNLSMALPPLCLQIVQQDGDHFISDVAYELSLKEEQQESINRVRINLKLLLISDLLVFKKNIIKHCFRNGLVDISYASSFCWPVSVPCRKDVSMWKRFISLISRSDPF